MWKAPNLKKQDKVKMLNTIPAILAAFNNNRALIVE